MAGAPKGNTNAVKLTTDKMKKDAFEQYLSHLSQGYPKRTFVYENGSTTVTWETMENYIKNYPIEFPSSRVKAALSKGEQAWIKNGCEMMMGKIEGKVQPVIFQIMMRNIYKWDREDTERTIVKTEAETLLKRWKGEDTEDD
jgi:hypothetical protein